MPCYLLRVNNVCHSVYYIYPQPSKYSPFGKYSSPLCYCEFLFLILSQCIICVCSFFPQFMSLKTSETFFFISSGPNINFSLLIYPYLGNTILLLKGWQHGRVHMNCQISLSFPLMFTYCAISPISCQSSLFYSMCLNTAQLRNHNYITVCFKQI
jgi:hypothetical protein